MAVDALKADLRQYFADARGQVEPLVLQLRSQAVIERLNMGISGVAEPRPGDKELEDGLRAVLNSHRGDDGALQLSLAAQAVLAENAQPESPTSSTPTGERPTLSSIAPTSAAIGDPPVTLTCTGTGFSDSTVIVFNGGAEPTDFVSDTQVTTLVDPTTAGTEGSYPVLVRNGFLESEPQQFTFTAAAPPEEPDQPPPPPEESPIAVSLVPDRITTSTGNGTARVMGTGFTAESRVVFDGVEKPTTFVDETEVMYMIAVADVTEAGVVQVVVQTGDHETDPLDFLIED